MVVETERELSLRVDAVKKGDRVAQLILERIAMADVAEVTELSETER
jgi:dUTPase